VNRNEEPETNPTQEDFELFFNAKSPQNDTDIDIYGKEIISDEEYIKRYGQQEFVKWVKRERDRIQPFTVRDEKWLNRNSKKT
jgi:hypothetical protein